jgi:hypothetical protein
MISGQRTIKTLVQLTSKVSAGIIESGLLIPLCNLRHVISIERNVVGLGVLENLGVDNFC